MRRIVVALALGAFLALATAAAASAKTPSFTVALSTDTPAPGEKVVVEVTFDQEFPAADLHGLLGLFPADAVDDELRPLRPYGFTPVGLRRARPGLYRGSFTAPTEPGDYVLVPFPNVADNYPTTDSYPAPVVLGVGDDRSAPAAVVLAGTATVAVMSALVARHRRRTRPVG